MALAGHKIVIVVVVLYYSKRQTQSDILFVQCKFQLRNSSVSAASLVEILIK